MMRTFEIVELTGSSGTGPLLEAAITPAAEPAPWDRLLMPAEVAALFGVGTKTITRWAGLGKLTAVRTLGGSSPIP